MGLDWVRVSLRGYGGQEPTGRSFFELLAPGREVGFPTSPSDSAWKAAAIELVEVAMDDCREAPEPCEEFVARIDAGLRKAAEWLLSIPLAPLERWRADGHKADVFIGGWLKGEQFDLALPPPFLLACGRLGLPIEICTND
jgi:hypothetical protein